MPHSRTAFAHGHITLFRGRMTIEVSAGATQYSFVPSFEVIMKDQRPLTQTYRIPMRRLRSYKGV